MRRVMLSFLLPLVFLALPTAAAELPSARFKLAAPGESATLTVPAIDAAKARAEDAATTKAGPRRYALGAAVAVAAQSGAKAAGLWSTTPDGRALWRLDVRAPGAVAVDLGFSTLFLPQGAALYIASADGSEVRGPYTDADLTRSGEFWTPLVSGDTARIEVVAPAALQGYVRLELAVVHSAYRHPFADNADPFSLDKSLSCHIDTACAAANPYRAQVRAAAGFTLNGPTNSGLQCSGTLLNNTAQDSKSYFLTANHCEVAASPASVVMYWQYESPTCRAQGSAASGTQVPVSVAIPQTGGVTVRADIPGTDSTLMQLNTPIPAAVNEYFAGWDRSVTLPSATAILHHSAGHEKRISFDDNAPVVNAAAVVLDTIRYDANASMTVTYDRGTTTEGGASGGGLFSPTGRVIGQLGGGPAGSCSLPITDTYGRVAVAWEGGGTAATRLRDWLAPGSTVESLPGKDACAAPTVTLTSNTATATAGVEVQFTAAIAGTGPFTVAWDVDNDGLVDRTANGVTGSTILPLAYPTRTDTTVSAIVTDAAGCTGVAQRAIVVEAPNVVLTSTARQQVCGDNDAAIEPGEVWRVPFSVTNTGGAALDGARAVFATSGGTATGGAGSVDAFGYRMVDSTDASNSCGFQAIALSGAATALNLTASDPQFPATDDGHTAALNLGPQGFDLYGARVNQLLMSTNGYLTVDLADDGGAFSHSCPDDFSTGSALAALHQDLVVRTGGGLYREYFATCPRTGEAGGGARGCTVFTWRHMAHYIPGQGGATEGDYTFQAIVYDGTHQIVYQYLEGAPDTGDASIGLIDTPSGVRSAYGCDNAGRAPPGRAVCFFHPTAQPAGTTPTPLIFNQPAVPLNNLATNQTQSGEIQFEVPEDAVCGAALQVNYIGTVDRKAYTLNGKPVLTTTVGGGATCQVNACAPDTQPVPYKDGQYSGEIRFGNGIAAYNIPVGNGRTVFGGQWFTGTRDRKPTWFTMQGDRLGAQADVPIYRFRQTGSQPFAAQGQIVGRGQASYIDEDELILTWNIEGVAGGERLHWFYGPDRPTPERTGSWVYGPLAAPEVGWGTAMDDNIVNGNINKILVNYIYDAAGEPVWTLGASTQLTQGTSEQATFAVHCPTCANLSDFFNTRQNAGSVTFNLTSLTAGTYATQITLPPPLVGTWNRTAQPWQMITLPVPQQ